MPIWMLAPWAAAVGGTASTADTATPECLNGYEVEGTAADDVCYVVDPDCTPTSSWDELLQDWMLGGAYTCDPPSLAAFAITLQGPENCGLTTFLFDADRRPLASQLVVHTASMCWADACCSGTPTQGIDRWCGEPIECTNRVPLEVDTGDPPDGTPPPHASSSSSSGCGCSSPGGRPPVVTQLLSRRH
jgi:hypothetical protein